MRRLLATGAFLALIPLVVMVSPPAGAQVPATYDALVGTATSLNDVSSVTVQPGTSGTYTLDWHVEQGGTVYPLSGSAAGTLTDGGTSSFHINCSTLPDGLYDVVGTISINSAPDATFSGVLTVDTTGPAVTSIVASRSTIYPGLATFTKSKYPGTVHFTVTGNISDATRFSVAQSSSGGAATARETHNPDGSVDISWDGNLNYSTRAPSGVWNLVFYDRHQNPSAVVGHVTVSGLHWVPRNWKKTVTAKSSLVDKYVGKCATLKSPSSHHWPGSLGLYSDTKCKTRSFKKGGVDTLHAIVVPETGPSYGPIRVDTNGGAASAKRTSTAVVAMVTIKNKLVNSYQTKSAVRINQAYPFYTNKNLVFANRKLYWLIEPSRPGDRYDVRSFTIHVKYYVPGY